MEHVTIMTGKLTESVEFYQKVIGLKAIRHLQGGPHEIYFMGQNETDVFVELVENKAESYNGKGLLIGFTVEDVRKKRQELLQDGYEVSDLVSPEENVVFFTVKDPNGVEIQLLSNH